MRRVMNRRDFLYVALVAATGTTLAACGATPTATPLPRPAPTSTPAPATPLPTATKAPQPTAAAAPTATLTQAPVVSTKAKIKVQYMNWWGGARDPILNEVISSFHKEYPDILVENSLQSSDKRVEQAATAISSRTPPAVIMAMVNEYIAWARQGLIVPIDSYVAKRNLDLYKIFYKGEIDTQRWDGKLWSMPCPAAGARAGMYIYDKNLMRKVNWDPDRPAATWEDMEKLGKAVQQMERDQIKVLSANIGKWHVNDNATWGGNFLEWLYTNNGTFLSEDAKAVTFNSAEGLETLEWMAKYMKDVIGGIEKYYAFGTGNDYLTADFSFYKERGPVMWIVGSWAFAGMKAQAPKLYDDPKAWGVGLRPYNNKNPKAKSAGVMGPGAWGNVIPKGQPKEVEEAAYLWVEFISAAEKGGCEFMLKQARNAPTKACNERPEYAAINPHWGSVLKSMEVDVAIPVLPVHAQIVDILSQNVEAVLFGQRTAKDALKTAQEKSQEVLDKFWKS